jgi:hypothetical protein
VLFELLTAITVESAVFCGVTPSIPLDSIYQTIRYLILDDSNFIIIRATNIYTAYYLEGVQSRLHSHRISFTSIRMISLHLHLGLPNDLFLSVFLTKLYAHLCILQYVLHAPRNSSPFNLDISIIYDEENKAMMLLRFLAGK